MGRSVISPSNNKDRGEMKMKKIIAGVYKIQNNQTGEMYIGCSSNTHYRWLVHKQRYMNELSKEYNKPLYVAMRDYGIESFSFDLLEEVGNIDNLSEKERLYIDHYNSEEEGYNVSKKGDNHPRALLSLEDVIDIRTRYENLESKRNVYVDYHNLISKGGFHKIWNGYTWPEIMPKVYTEENKLFHKNNTGSAGESNSRTSLVDEDVILIRKKKEEGKKAKLVYENYKEKISYRSFLNVWYGYNWKHLGA